jgi:hypothetical protein
MAQALAGMVSPASYEDSAAAFGTQLGTLDAQSGHGAALGTGLFGWNVGKIWAGLVNRDAYTGQPIGDWYQRSTEIANGVVNTIAIVAPFLRPAEAATMVADANAINRTVTGEQAANTVSRIKGEGAPAADTAPQGLTAGQPCAGTPAQSEFGFVKNDLSGKLTTWDTSASRPNATTWRQHEAAVTQELRANNPPGAVGRQVTLDVTDPATGQTVTIIIDNTVQTQTGIQLVDAKFSRVRNLADPNVNLSSTVTDNQGIVYDWISQGKQVTVVPRGNNAFMAGFAPGQPIPVNPSVQIRVNSPGGITVRNY